MRTQLSSHPKRRRWESPPRFLSFPGSSLTGFRHLPRQTFICRRDTVHLGYSCKTSFPFRAFFHQKKRPARRCCYQMQAAELCSRWDEAKMGKLLHRFHPVKMANSCRFHPVKMANSCRFHPVKSELIVLCCSMCVLWKFAQSH